MAATVLTTCTIWLAENEVSLVALQWGILYTIPPVLCVLVVHMVCRNFFTIMWFSAKLLLSALVYVHLRDLIESSVGPMISIEDMIFGISDTPNRSLSIGFALIRMQALMLSRRAIAGVCPSCVAHPEPSAPPPDDVHIPPMGWVDWISDTI